MSSQIKSNTIVVGDFNAHIGKKDISPGDAYLIGPNLFHERNNDNGTDLKNLLHLSGLRLKNTFEKSKSLRITWKIGSSESQIDHVLMSHKHILNCIKMYAKWTSVKTDHTILITALRHPKLTDKGNLTSQPQVGPEKTRATQFKQKNPKALTWNALNLKDEQARLNYKVCLDSRLKARKNPQATNPNSALDAWTSLKQCIQTSASATLSRPTSPITPRRRKACAKLEQAKFKSDRDPSNPTLKIALKQARKEKFEANQAHVGRQCDDFFRNLNSHHPAERVQKTLKFLKKYKRESNRPQKKTFIPISHWQDDLKLSSLDEQVVRIKETDHFPLGQPPSPETILGYLKKLKNNTAPGNDKINVELLKYGPPSLLQEIAITISRVWDSNNIPEDWLETTQIPIPKNRNPKSTLEYRKITLCNTIYKIYAKFLLEKLTECIEAMPLYQAGFQHNRSTDDHVFTAKSILDERWRKGQVTYVLSLDLKQAFDRLKLDPITAILKL